MTTETYGNRELARDYLRAMSMKDGIKQGYKNVSKKISASTIDIPLFYEESGSLEGLTVMGVSKDTMKLLERILSEGVEKVGKEFEEEKLRGEVNLRVVGRPLSKHTKDYEQGQREDPGFEGELRRREG